ncbi:MAG: adenylate/guanylate cyclase domain-containing protein [Chitinophagales bacterium]|nr:adenylate/guanylate cyclase domain-containing protein [Chitinophagales bacterium]
MNEKLFLLNQYVDRISKKIPIVNKIPGFNSMPANITPANLRFYKLSNLVLTLGMLVHFSWVFLFYFMGANEMAYINIFSVIIYIFAIVINRKGNHFASSNIMVFEIIIHQFIAIQYFGWNAGFQNYVIVIGLFPFLMPKGKWLVKGFLLTSCLLTYILFDVFLGNNPPIFVLESNYLNYLKVSNILFSFISMAISGAYFNYAMHETEDLLDEKKQELILEKSKSDELLLNILPAETALELKQLGYSKPKHVELASILFTDFVNFSKICEQMNAENLVNEIDYFYSSFDSIIAKYGIEKIKTIGDSYMCVGGIPMPNDRHPVNIVFAAIEMRDFIIQEKKLRLETNRAVFDIRIGIHCGPVVAGIVGTKKFAYDIWGDAVNIASRMESSGEASSINISLTMYELIKDHFTCHYRGKLAIKNKGEVDMYIVEGVKS